MDMLEALKTIEDLGPERALNALLAWSTVNSQDEDEAGGEISSMLIARMIIGLREVGLSEKQINDFQLWITTGNEQYLPHK